MPTVIELSDSDDDAPIAVQNLVKKIRQRYNCLQHLAAPGGRTCWRDNDAHIPLNKSLIRLWAALILTSAKDGTYLHSTTALPDTAAFKAIRKQASPRRPTAILTPPTSAVKVEPSSPPLRSNYDSEIPLEQSPSKQPLPRSRRSALQQAQMHAPKLSGSTTRLRTRAAATTLGQQFQGNISRNVSMDAWQRGTGASIGLVYALKATGITSPAMFLDIPFEDWDKRHREGGLNLTRGQISELRLCGEMWASGQMAEPLRQMRTRAMYGKGRGYSATPKIEAFY